jgi:hypothetical protein
LARVEYDKQGGQCACSRCSAARAHQRASLSIPAELSVDPSSSGPRYRPQMSALVLTQATRSRSWRATSMSSPN